MKRILTLVSICFIASFLTECHKSDNSTWENVKTAGRYLNRTKDNLCNRFHNDKNLSEYVEDEFVPLSDSDLKLQFASTDMAIPQSRLTPGAVGSGIPGLDNFVSPSEELSTIFKNVHFNTDSHVLRNREDLVVLRKIAEFLKQNPEYFLVVEGHCDERASAAYNMALGTRRSNFVRSMIVKYGVDLNRIYTISYGKEKPIAKGHSSEDWQLNRRAQFKIHKK